jgi:hypothetical protein
MISRLLRYLNFVFAWVYPPRIGFVSASSLSTSTSSLQVDVYHCLIRVTIPWKIHDRLSRITFLVTVHCPRQSELQSIFSRWAKRFPRWVLSATLDVSPRSIEMVWCTNLSFFPELVNSSRYGIEISNCSLGRQNHGLWRQCLSRKSVIP